MRWFACGRKGSPQTLAVERRTWGRWQLGTSEQDRPAGEGRARASLKRPFTGPTGFHGNPVFLFLEKEVPQQLLWVLEPRVTVGARSGEWRRVDRPRGPGRRVWRARARDRLAGPAGALGVPSPHAVCAPAFCHFALCFLQIMIEFCPGGAVDAIMLGESSSTRCRGARPGSRRGRAPFTPPPQQFT